MERKNVALMSYIILLQFSYEHNERIISKINKPTVWNSEEHLTLYHNSVYQLNLLPNSNSLKSDSKIKSLFDVINFTSTSMGKRLLKYRLANPITNINKLEKRYNLIDIYLKIFNKNNGKKIKQNLNEIIDIERLHRKMALEYLNPCEFYSLTVSYININNLIKLLTKIYNLDNLELCDSDITKFQNFQKEYSNEFNLSEMAKYNMNLIESSFIKKGFSVDIDNIQRKIDECMSYMKNECTKLSNLIEPGSNFIKLYNTERDGYFMSLTKNRHSILLKNMKKKKIENEYNNKKHTGSSLKLINDKFTECSNNYIYFKEIIKKKVKEYYIKKLNYYDKKYSKILKKICYSISVVDIIHSSAECSLKYGYCKPEINVYDMSTTKPLSSYFNATEIRHPIIERLPFSPEYITNNISLNIDINGILLYGVNGSGKSSLSKAVGLNIILAQMGMYVPCKKFTYYPYTKIFTRINSDDNIFKGQSSFVVEMCELRSILKYANSNSIVLGDEICKGTEEVSALSIVFASIKRFIQNNVNFLLATHFHKLYPICRKNNIEKISFKHLSVNYDNDKIIYGRKLKNGIGNNLYGLEIAKFIIEDNLFITDANDTRNNILNKSINLIEPKISNYNSKLYVDYCIICKNNDIEKKKDEVLHTHHINEQCNFDKNKLLHHKQKDHLDNLVVLCEKHHNEVHNGQLVISGYKHTNMGKILEYSYLKKKRNNKKYNIKDINIILSYNNSPLTMKIIINELKNKNDIKISASTVRKIWKGLY